MDSGEKSFSLLKKMDPQKSELDLINKFFKAMTLEACVKKIMVSSALVILRSHTLFLFTVCMLVFFSKKHENTSN